MVGGVTRRGLSHHAKAACERGKKNGPKEYEMVVGMWGGGLEAARARGTAILSSGHTWGEGPGNRGDRGKGESAARNGCGGLISHQQQKRKKMENKIRSWQTPQKKRQTVPRWKVKGAGRLRSGGKKHLLQQVTKNRNIKRTKASS